MIIKTLREVTIHRFKPDSIEKNKTSFEFDNSNEVFLFVVQTYKDHYTGGRYYIFEVALALCKLGKKVVWLCNNTPTCLESFTDYECLKNLTVVVQHQGDPSPSIFSKEYIFSNIVGTPLGCIDCVADYKCQHLDRVTYYQVILVVPPLARQYRSGVDVVDDGIGWDSIKNSLRYVDMFWTLTELSKEWIVKWLGVSKQKIHVIVPAINDKVANKFLNSPKEDEIVFISRFVSYKNPMYVLEVAKRISYKGKITMIGGAGGLAYSQFYEYAEKNNLNLSIIEKCDDYEKFRIIARSKILIYPTLWEDFGMPPLEAAYYGIQTITYPNPTFKQIYGNLLVYAKRGDIDDLARLTKTSLRNSRLSFEFRELVLKKYCFNSLVKNVNYALLHKKSIDKVEHLDKNKIIPQDKHQKKNEFDKKVSFHFLCSLAVGNGYGNQAWGLIESFDKLKVNFDLSTTFAFNFNTFTSKQKEIYEKYKKPIYSQKNLVFLPSYDNINMYEDNYNFTMFERDRIPQKWAAVINLKYNKVFVPTEENKRAFFNSGVRVPISVIPLSLDTKKWAYCRHKRWQTFIFGFSAHQKFFKNAVGIIAAFQQAFPIETDVKLIIHTHNSPELPRGFLECSDERIIIDKEVYSEVEYVNWFKKLNCYISLSKGDGWDVPLRQALSQGIPCICSNNTGHRNLVDAGLVYSVESELKELGYYRMIKVKPPNVGHQYKPNYSEASKQMRHVYHHYKEALEKAKKGSDYIKKTSGWDKQAKMLIEEISEKSKVSVSKKLSVGLVFPSHGEHIWAEGYSVTSHYLEKALKRHSEVGSVIRVGFKDFGRLKNKKLDLIISLDHGFGDKFFKLSGLKFMWWLTPKFVNPVGQSTQDVINSKYDGIFSCSVKTVFEIDKYKPCIFIPLAVDKDFRFEIDRKYQHNIVYMGTYPLKADYQYDLLFEPAIKHGLVIYGKGWQNSKYAKFHRGLLRFEDINKLYSSAKIVLAMSKKECMDLSIIPNRVYEALACRAIVIAEYYSELQRRLGEYMILVKTPNETKEYMSYLLSKDNSKVDKMTQMGKEWVLTYQTYDHRVKEMIDFYKELKK